MKKVLLLLANGCEAVEASVFTDVIGWNKFEGDGTTDLVTVGLHNTIKCTWNFTITPEMHISEVNIDEFDVAFKLLELLTSEENCNNVKHMMGFFKKNFIYKKMIYSNHCIN